MRVRARGWSELVYRRGEDGIEKERGF